MLSKKVIITGSFGVGKTSLFHQFLYKKFSDRYLTTIGVKVDKKTVEVGDDSVNLLLWDVAGEISQDKIPSSYFLGSSGIIYVFDLTRRVTLGNLVSDLEFLQNKLPGVIIRVVGNKKDLVDPERLATLQAEYPDTIDFFTSAKTGENVEDMFRSLAKEFVDK